MTKKYRLQSMQSAQCHVVIDINDETGHLERVGLVSYNTLVCEIFVGRPYRLACYGTYSVTTAKHINRFTTDFCGENLYYECKKLVQGNPKYPYMPLTAKQGLSCMQEAIRYYNDAFIMPVRKYFGKY